MNMAKYSTGAMKAALSPHVGVNAKPVTDSKQQTLQKIKVGSARKGR